QKGESDKNNQKDSAQGGKNPNSGEDKDKKNDSSDQGEKDKKFAQTPQDQRKRSFKSQKMSKEDADRVMNELKDRESGLQQKLKKQNNQGHANAKDW
ncbi:MAG: hypothetical protein AABZ55_02570, partial [Bdellovibrionota bacterium]